MRGAVGELDVLGDALKRDMCRDLTRKVVSEREAWNNSRTNQSGGRQSMTTLAIPHSSQSKYKYQIIRLIGITKALITLEIVATAICDIDRSIAETLQDLFIFINLVHSLSYKLNGGRATGQACLSKFEPHSASPLCDIDNATPLAILCNHRKDLSGVLETEGPMPDFIPLSRSLFDLDV